MPPELPGWGRSAVVIRSARPADVVRLAQLLSWGAVRAVTDDPGDPVPYLRALAEIADTAHNEVLVAELDGS